MSNYKFPAKYKGVHRVVVHYSNSNLRVMPRDADNNDVNLYPDLTDEIHFYLNKIGILKFVMFRGVFYYKDKHPSFCGDVWSDEENEFVPFILDVNPDMITL